MAKQENGDKPHSIRYIRQMIEWGFDKEFIAKDCGINVSSLDVRLNREMFFCWYPANSVKWSAYINIKFKP